MFTWIVASVFGLILIVLFSVAVTLFVIYKTFGHKKPKENDVQGRKKEEAETVAKREVLAEKEKKKREPMKAVKAFIDKAIPKIKKGASKVKMFFLTLLTWLWNAVVFLLNFFKSCIEKWKKKRANETSLESLAADKRKSEEQNSAPPKQISTSITKKRAATTTSQVLAEAQSSGEQNNALPEKQLLELKKRIGEDSMNKAIQQQAEPEFVLFKGKKHFVCQTISEHYTKRGQEDDLPGINCVIAIDSLMNKFFLKTDREENKNIGEETLAIIEENSEKTPIETMEQKIPENISIQQEIPEEAISESVTIHSAQQEQNDAVNNNNDPLREKVSGIIQDAISQEGEKPVSITELFGKIKDILSYKPPVASFKKTPELENKLEDLALSEITLKISENLKKASDNHAAIMDSKEELDWRGVVHENNKINVTKAKILSDLLATELVRLRNKGSIPYNHPLLQLSFKDKNEIRSPHDPDNQILQNVEEKIRELCANTAVSASTSIRN